MDFIFLDLKENFVTVPQAIALAEIELERAKFANVKIMKILHGYGSHGKGGLICIAIRNWAQKLKKEGKIKDFLNGFEWSLNNSKVQNALTKCKNVDIDNDINNNNPGITVLLI